VLHERLATRPRIPIGNGLAWVCWRQRGNLAVVANGKVKVEPTTLGAEVPQHSAEAGGQGGLLVRRRGDRGGHWRG
jgi:hypothetical protein